jgi:hypothetical protein
VYVVSNTISNIVSRFKCLASSTSREAGVPGRFHVPRSFHLPPEVRDKDPITPEGTDLAIWTWESNGKPYGIAFSGKANKPLWNYRFLSEADRARRIEETIAGQRTRLKMKEDRQQERREFKHESDVGDIYYTSWGYDQTNIDFYEVVEVRGKVLLVRKIAEKSTGGHEATDYVVAVPGKFTGPVKRVRPSGQSFTIDGHSASKWDGKPKYQTAFGYGH